ncbi:MAG: hypothetical protein MUE54_00870 [Anaerolineae bacterium]|nr:hypothetical protein [Anaerolineae bacterium]
MKNTNNTLKLWSNLLLVAVIFNVVLGIALTFSPDIIKNTIFRLYIDFYYSRGGAFEALPPQEVTLQAWFFGFAGSLIVGWMVLMGMIVYIPFRRGEKWAWVAVFVSSIVWFVLDSFTSAVNGMAINLIPNVLTIIVFLVALGATYRTFFGTPDEK